MVANNSLQSNFSDRILVFISYSHNEYDHPLKERLVGHLNPLTRQGIIAPWHDQDILPGDNWSSTIDINLNNADIILLLLSADFDTSAYCQTEVDRAMQRQRSGEALVIPVVLRPVMWELPPYSNLQVLPKGNDGKVVAVTAWSDRDAAFENIAQGIQKVAGKIRRDRALKLFRSQLNINLRQEEVSEQRLEALLHQVGLNSNDSDVNFVEFEEIQQYHQELQRETEALDQDTNNLQSHVEDTRQTIEGLEKLCLSSQIEQRRQQFQRQIEEFKQDEQHTQTEIERIQHRRQFIAERSENLLRLLEIKRATLNADKLFTSTAIQVTSTTIQGSLEGIDTQHLKPEYGASGISEETSDTSELSGEDGSEETELGKVHNKTTDSGQQAKVPRGRNSPVQLPRLTKFILLALLLVGLLSGLGSAIFFIVEQLSLDGRISAGEKNFTEAEDCQNKSLDEAQKSIFKEKKQLGVTLIKDAQEAEQSKSNDAKEKYEQAARALEGALIACGAKGGIDIGNAPETRIYYNNALIGTDKAYVLGVAAPIKKGNGPVNVRGVAQRQAEINKEVTEEQDPAKKSLQYPVKVLLLDDGNDEKIAEKLVEKVASRSDILGIIGHQTSSIMMAAKPKYETLGLPAISPSATTGDFGRNPGKQRQRYTFRTTPSVEVMAQKIYEHIIKNPIDKGKVAVLFSSGSNKDYSESFKDALIQPHRFGDQIPIYDLNDDASTNALINKSDNREIQALFIAVSVSSDSETLTKLNKVTERIKNQVELFGGNALYSPDFLQGLVRPNDSVKNVKIELVSPWINPDTKPDHQRKLEKDVFNLKQEVRSKNSAFWNYSPNWFTLMSYDATSAFIEAIRRSSFEGNIEQARKEIRKQLSDPNFEVPGAFINFRFHPNGDRLNITATGSTEAAKAYLSRVSYCNTNTLSYCYSSIDDQSTAPPISNP